MEKHWVVYMLECKDGSLYTGVTDRLQHRLAMHRSGKGAKYTKGRAPLVLRYLEDCDSRSDALKREASIKKLSKAQKWELCNAAPKTLAEF